jgi:hypothetical protein
MRELIVKANLRAVAVQFDSCSPLGEGGKIYHYASVSVPTVFLRQPLLMLMDTNPSLWMHNSTSANKLASQEPFAYVSRIYLSDSANHCLCANVLKLHGTETQGRSVLREDFAGSIREWLSLYRKGIFVARYASGARPRTVSFLFGSGRMLSGNDRPKTF